jgi:hypothetical protein
MLSSHIGEDANVGASQECQICLNGMISRDASDGNSRGLHVPCSYSIPAWPFFEILRLESKGKLK